MNESWFWLLPAFLSGQLAASIWQRCRRGHGVTGFEMSCAVVAGYVGLEYGPDLFAVGGLLVLVPVALFGLALSPIVAFWYYGRGGAIRQWSLRAALFLLFFLVALLVCAGTLELSPEGTVAVAFGSAFAIWKGVPWFRRRFKAQFQQWRWRRNERRQAQPAEIPPRPEDKQLIASLQQEADAAQKEIRQQKRTLEKTQQRKEAKEQRRQEIMVHVRRIRREQRSALDQGLRGLHYHPSSYGFLLAEAGRVLRAEIKAGDRIPAIEADPFLFDVVEKLIQDNDFEERYFHRAGAKAITAVQIHLSGDEPLDKIRARLKRLKLEPKQLAPEPLAEPLLSSLLEAWLEPHRKFQIQQWHLFIAKKHPELGPLSDFLRAQGLEKPEEKQWIDCWDASPAPFVGKPIQAKHHQKTRFKWQLMNWHS